jgi:xylulokinase
MAVVCVDAGTTTVKAVAFDDEGRVLSVARAPTLVHRRENGFSEQDMDGVWNAVVRTICTVVDEVSRPVSMLAFTGQGDGCWLVDADGRPTGPAVLWNDARATEIVERWDRDGVLEQAFRINGALGFPGTSAAIMSWLHAHDRARLDASHAALYCDGWLFHRFTGTFAADESDAATPFLDIGSREYSHEILELFDMPWAERLLPPILTDEQRVGSLLPRVATELRLPSGLPVVMAPFDIPATAIGIGAIDAGQACTVLGTTLSTEFVLASPDTSGTPAGMMIPSGVETTYVHSLAAMAGTDVITWGLQLLGLDDPESLSELADEAEPGAGGLLFHPYLSPAGERAPIRTPLARGSLVGLSVEHTRAHVARALFEGLSYVIRDCLAFAPVGVDQLRLCGGGANSDFWCRILADVTGVPTVRSLETEIGAKGAFITALAATGQAASIHRAVADSVRIGDVFEPDRENAKLYAELFADYLATRSAVGAEWPRLAQVRARIGDGALRAMR